MSLHTPLRTLLSSWSEVTSLLTHNPKSNDLPIRPERLHQTDDLPAIEIAIPNEEFEDDLAGNQNASTSTVLITVVSAQVDQANTIADAILTRGTNPPTGLLGFTGSAGSKMLNSVDLLTRKSGYARNPDGSDSGEYVVVLTFEIWSTT